LIIKDKKFSFSPQFHKNGRYFQVILTKHPDYLTLFGHHAHTQSCMHMIRCLYWDVL